MKLSKFRSTFFIATLLLGGIAFTLAGQSVSAQGVSPTATPTVNIVPTLQSVIATQQADIDKLVDEERDRKYYDRDIQWKWGILAAVGAAVTWILTWVGKNSLQSLQLGWEQRSQKILDKAIYKLDLGNLPIYLPAGEKLENIHNFLQRRKFEALKFYNHFDEFERGILIVSLKGKDENQQAEILGKFKDFIETKNPGMSDSGFIIYAPGRIRVPDDIMECHDNLVTANYPATVVSSIFSVGRGIEIVLPNS